MIPVRPRPSEQGFTLMELVVVMGLLAGFLLMLSRILTAGVELFDEGSEGQNLADRARTAGRRVVRILEGLTGPGLEDPAPRFPQARLLVQPVPLGLPGSLEDGQTTVQVLRGRTTVFEEVERRLWEPLVREQVQARIEEEGLDVALEEEVRQRMARLPLRGEVGTMLLPWPAGDEDGAYLELRRGLFLPGTTVQPERGDPVDPMLVPVVGSRELPAGLVHAVTRPVVEGLLHFELRFWSQYTRGWDEERGRHRFERVWDSARAGWLLGETGERDRDGLWTFGLDLGTASLTDPRDDVFPRMVRAIVVVGRDPAAPPLGRLAAPIGAEDRTLRLIDADLLPRTGEPMVKVGGEWIRYDRVNGDRLVGLQRGRRGTPAAAHDAGTGVRVGRTLVLDVALPFGQDSWNG